MKIIVTDGYTLNPGDLSWNSIKKFGELILYERTPKELVAERCREADIILTNKVPIHAGVIEASPNLKLIGVTATGYNIVDVEAAKQRNIAVCNVPNYGTFSVAQHTFALILEVTNRVGTNGESVRRGDWQRSNDFCYTLGSLTELQGKILGIVGLGNIGKQVATIAKAFGMKVIYYSRTKHSTDLADYTDLNTLFRTSDIISLHCPLTQDNNQFVNRELLSLIKPWGILVNTSRGQLIQEQDLADALESGKLAGAALDVLSVEPPTKENPLTSARNCLITPHTAWMSFEARTRILQITIENIEGFLKNKPLNRV